METPRNVVKPKMPTNIHSELVNVAAHISLYVAIPKNPQSATITSEVMGKGKASVAHMTTAARSTMIADWPSRDRSSDQSGPNWPTRINTIATTIQAHLNSTLFFLTDSAMFSLPSQLDEPAAS